MTDQADIGEYGLHTNWENCEGGLCCDEALAIIKALVAERDAWKVEALHHNAEEIRLREALEAVAAQQPKTLAMIEHNGFVFDSIGKEPGNWQHLAFSVYTDLCEVDTVARAVLGKDA